MIHRSLKFVHSHSHPAQDGLSLECGALAPLSGGSQSTRKAAPRRRTPKRGVQYKTVASEVPATAKIHDEEFSYCALAAVVSFGAAVDM